MDILEHRLVLPTALTEFRFRPFACVHEDEGGHHAELWAECVETIANDPDCFTIGNGDYFSFARTHLRTHIRSYKDDENALRDLDDMVKDRARAFHRKHLVPMKGKLLGLAEGNHHWTFMNGTTSTQYLCELAEVPYFGVASGHNVYLYTKADQVRSFDTLQLLVHHGDWGAAQTIGGDLNSVERKSAPWDADIYVYAHTHRKIAWKEPYCSWPTKPQQRPIRIKERARVYIRCGSFLRGYMPGCSSYVEKKLLRPTDLGWVTTHIKYGQPYDPEQYARERAVGQGGDKAHNRSRLAIQPKFRVEY